MQTPKSVLKPISLEVMIETATVQSWRDVKLMVMMIMGFTLDELLAVTQKELPLFLKLQRLNLMHPVFVYALTETKTEDRLKIEKKAFLEFLKSSQ